MAEYIEREAFLKSVLTAGIGKTIAEYSESDIGYMIRKQPAADVAPVKHGKWILYPSAHYFKCSECKYTVPYRKAALLNGDRGYRYCPHCGAKMDLEE